MFLAFSTIHVFPRYFITCMCHVTEKNMEVDARKRSLKNASESIRSHDSDQDVDDIVDRLAILEDLFFEAAYQASLDFYQKNGVPAFAVSDSHVSESTESMNPEPKKKPKLVKQGASRSLLGLLHKK